MWVVNLSGSEGQIIVEKSGFRSSSERADMKPIESSRNLSAIA